MSRVWCHWLFVGHISACLPGTPELTNTALLGCDDDADCVNGMSCTEEGFCKEGSAICGDGVIDAEFGETCDDGNDATNDSCPSGPGGTCQSATCGDGFIWDTDGGTETCEPGVSEVLSCQVVDNAELEGFAVCSEVLCRYDSTACFDGPLGFMRVDAGTFTMGSPDSEPGHIPDETEHEVSLTRAFYLMEHEVTQAQWEGLIGNNPSQKNNGTCPTCPVETVNWWEALHFANAMSESEDLTTCYVFEGCSDNAVGADRECTGVTLQDSAGNTVTTPYECEGYRLPTEAEWEYAARAGTATAYYNGDITLPDGSDPNAEQIAWYGANSGSTTHAVKTKDPNAWGLYDMSGNVSEWTWDWYDFRSPEDALIDPVGSNPESLSRVFRGGSWFSRASALRSAGRAYGTPGYGFPDVGFRLARTAPQ